MYSQIPCTDTSSAHCHQWRVCFVPCIPCCTSSGSWVFPKCQMCPGVLVACFEKHRAWLCKAITMYSTFPLRTDVSATEVLPHLQSRNISLDVSSWIPRKQGTQSYHPQTLGFNHFLYWLHRSVCQRQSSDMDFTAQTLICLNTWILCLFCCSHSTSPQRPLWAGTHLSTSAQD